MRAQRVAHPSQNLDIGHRELIEGMPQTPENAQKALLDTVFKIPPINQPTQYFKIPAETCLLIP